ncbi:MAG: iron ABC transporter permease [Hyphomicrobiaceae bacterium]|nr:iron ABC transporter permease [Hyphomicrobiaceae bacterium]
MTISAAEPALKRQGDGLSLGGWGWGALVVAGLVAMPIVVLVVLALSGPPDDFIKIATSVLPRSAWVTFLLLAGVSLVAGSIGSISAWLVSFFEFPFRRVIAWLLVLPLAVPTYISAYAFAEFFAFTGPIQGLVRQIGGFQLARDYWFPDIRSLPGAVMVLGLVLYPYVYLSLRVLFRLQGRRATEAAEILGASQRRIFFRVLLPLARPALALGIILALMEALNDIGAIQYLGVQTLTLSVFTLWANQSNLAGASQLALALLIAVGLLIWAERRARVGQMHAGPAPSSREPFERTGLSGTKAWAALVACSLPVIFGFGIPFLTLGANALRDLSDGIDRRLVDAVGTSVFLSLGAALVTAALALYLSYSVRLEGAKRMRILVRIASVGYAVPGTVLAIGLLLPLSFVDNLVDGFMRDWFGVATGLLITGSGATLIYAYSARFMAMAEGTIDGALSKISPNLDLAAMVYGQSRWGTLRHILLPLISPAILTAMALVFIETMKELSATMVLRPFGVETVAIYVHDLATAGRIEQGALGAFMIMLVGIIPVAILTHTAERSETSGGAVRVPSKARQIRSAAAE